MNEKSRILNYCTEIFLKEGFFKISMDNIAVGLGVSKKTLYKHFTSKENLVSSVIENILRNIKNNLEKISSGDSNAILKLKGVSRFFSNFSIKVSDKWLNDIRTYGPQHWERIEQFRAKVIYKTINQILNQGKKEGLIVDHPNEIILKIFLSAIQGVINPEFILNNNFSIKEAIRVTLNILFNGILTKKGRKVFKQIDK
jgi:AcrR family transcriptional regulator